MHVLNVSDPEGDYFVLDLKARAILPLKWIVKYFIFQKVYIIETDAYELINDKARSGQVKKCPYIQWWYWLLIRSTQNIVN